MQHHELQNMLTLHKKTPHIMSKNTEIDCRQVEETRVSKLVLTQSVF